jgi:hypothetical protein
VKLRLARRAVPVEPERDDATLRETQRVLKELESMTARLERYTDRLRDRAANS